MEKFHFGSLLLAIFPVSDKSKFKENLSLGFCCIFDENEGDIVTKYLLPDCQTMVRTPSGR